MWTYRVFDEGGEPNLWQRWYDENPQFRGTHDAVFRILEQLDNWKPPYADFLNKDKRIVEVRLNGNIKHRILGFVSPVTRREFIVLGTCTHKQRVYDPPDIKKTVVKRKKDVERDLTRTIACARPTEPTKPH